MKKGDIQAMLAAIESIRLRNRDAYLPVIVICLQVREHEGVSTKELA